MVMDYSNPNKGSVHDAPLARAGALERGGSDEQGLIEGRLEPE
jgi:hypothetical protein